MRTMTTTQMQIIITIIILSVHETTHHQNLTDSVALSISLLQQIEDLQRSEEEEDEEQEQEQ